MATTEKSTKISKKIDKLKKKIKRAEKNDEDYEYIDMLETQLAYLKYERDNLN